MNENEEECIICTENLINARKLGCNHYFHLICLSKWIEKGNKNCPICRKEIDFQNNNLSMNQGQNNGIWSFGLRLDSRLFSWLPNLTFRVIRINGQNNDILNNTNNENNFNNIQPELDPNLIDEINQENNIPSYNN
jgi:hypothetical protein